MGEAQTRPGSEHPREALDPRGECLELSQLECEHSLSRANTLKQELRGQTLRNFGSEWVPLPSHGKFIKTVIQRQCFVFWLSRERNKSRYL